MASDQPRTVVPRPFDHGELQIPLRKRLGNVDAQIEAWKKAQKREHAAAWRAGQALVAEARAAVRRMSDERLAELGKPHGLTVTQARKMMLVTASARPEQTIRALAREASSDAAITHEPRKDRT